MPDLNLIDLVKEAVQSRPIDKWPAFDGTWLDRSKFMTSSEAGNCERQIWFDKHTEVKPANSHEWGFFERGHNVEAWVVEQLIASAGAVKYLFLGADQKSFYSGYQSGTPDGIALVTEGVWNLEFKSIDPRTNLKNLPKEKNELQCIQNMDLLAECTDYNVLGTKLLYINASDYTKMYEYEVPLDDNAYRVMGTLEDKAEKIMTAKSADDLEPEGIFNGGCTYCKHTTQCSGMVELKANERKARATTAKIAKGIFK